MISFVCWKWAHPGSMRTFLSQHVNVLRSMLERNCKTSHRLVCVTDDPNGLDGRVHYVPMPDKTFVGVMAPLQPAKGRRPKVAREFPSCYRRLWNFSREARAVLGDRIVAIDIDVVICGSIDALLARDADFVGWCDPRFEWSKVAGGLYMLTTGSHPEVWEQFDPLNSPRLARAAGNLGSDQAWLSHMLYPPAYYWSAADGIAKINWLEERAWRPPPAIRMAFTAGHSPPWNPEMQRRYPWILDHWKISR